MPAKRIGIIGAGPAGLAALKTTLEAPEYHNGEWADPVVLEAREDVGGVWLPAPASFPGPNILSVTTTTDALSRPPTSQAHYPPTPLYDSLTTNLPHPVMAFSSFPFPPSTPLFPKASTVHYYLAAYADQVVGNTNSPRRMREYVKTGRRVTSIGWTPEAESSGGSETSGDRGGGGFWDVEAQAEEGTEAPRVERYAFDLLLICTGHYSTPNYPSEDDMPGISAWRAAGRAAHAVWYRNAESIPLPAGDNDNASQQDGKRNKSTIGGENLNDASIKIIPPERGKNKSQEDSDTHFEEVYEKAVADAQNSGHIPHPNPHPHQEYGKSSDTGSGTGNNISNSSHIHDPAADGGRLSRATVLIVGAGPSGTDIAADLVRAGVRRVIIASSSTPSTPPKSSPAVIPSTGDASASVPTVIAKPLPVRFHVAAADASPLTGAPTLESTRNSRPTGRVTFADGTVEDGIAFVVLATGYQVDFPFFDQTSTPTSNTNTAISGSMAHEKFRLPKGVLPTPFWSDDGEPFLEGAKLLTNSNICVFPLGRHLFSLPGFYSGSNLLGEKNILGNIPVPHPTSLAFLGLNVRVAPLPLVEAQARAALSAFAYCASPQTLRTEDRNDNVQNNDLDWDVEDKAIHERWDMLAAQYEESKGRGQTAQGGEEAEEEFLKRKFIAKIWHRLPEDEQFAYRDDLDRFAFDLNYPALDFDHSSSKDGAGPHKTREWEPRVYAQKGVLRSAWRALEARGDGSAEEWVRGVGSGKTGRRKKKGPGDDRGEVMNGEEEWVDMMERLVVWWETEGSREDEERIARANDTRLEGNLEIPYEGDVQI